MESVRCQLALGNAVMAVSRAWSRSTYRNFTRFQRTIFGGDQGSQSGRTLPAPGRCIRGHYQPRIPGELGFYDLRVPETREAQAFLAAMYGVSAFCYWHYWFGGGRRLLERPFEEVLKSGRPDFHFAWDGRIKPGRGFGMGHRTASWFSRPMDGERDYRAHFESVLPAFMDPRVPPVDGRPLFLSTTQPTSRSPALP